MPHVVTVTLNPTIDKSCSTEQVVPEHKLRCGDPVFEPGGGGLNVSRAMHYLDGASRALWSCGGALGELLRERLEAEQIDHQPVPISEMTRENLIVYEQSSGQQFRFGMPGPRLTATEMARWLEVIERLDPPPDWLVVSGSLPPGVDDDFYAQLIARAPASCRTIVDTSAPALGKALAAGVYLIKPNLRELGQLVECEIDSDAELRDAAQEILRGGQVKVVVVSLGSGGAVLVTADSYRRFRAPTAPIRSKVGAGDSMVAGLVLSLSRDWPLEDAVRFGVAAGAAAVMTPGTQLCRREDVEQLYESG